MWRVVMIKTPVSYDENELIYYPLVTDVDGDYLFETMDTDTANEINKRINMHDELVKSLRDMVEIVGSNFCQNMEIKHKYKAARELLDRCK